MPSCCLCNKHIKPGEKCEVTNDMLYDASTYLVHTKCLKEYQRKTYPRNENTLIEKIKAAEKEKDFELLAKLLKQKQKMAILTEKNKTALQR